jgi:hypothetical protein
LRKEKADIPHIGNSQIGVYFGHKDQNIIHNGKTETKTQKKKKKTSQTRLPKYPPLIFSQGGTDKNEEGEKDYRQSEYYGNKKSSVYCQFEKLKR